MGQLSSAPHTTILIHCRVIFRHLKVLPLYPMQLVYNLPKLHSLLHFLSCKCCIRAKSQTCILHRTSSDHFTWLEYGSVDPMHLKEEKNFLSGSSKSFLPNEDQSPASGPSTSAHFAFFFLSGVCFLVMLYKSPVQGLSLIPSPRLTLVTGLVMWEGSRMCFLFFFVMSSHEVFSAEQH